MSKYAWVDDYSDVPSCIELIALWDDSIKKETIFTDYAIEVANAILKANKANCKAHYGKWGARLVLGKGTDCSGVTDRERLEHYADLVVKHPSWVGLSLSSHVFTYEAPTVGYQESPS